jgi:predicted metal-dependent hydrolase
MFKEHQLRLDWAQELPKYYFDNSPFKTHLLNALSITFPDGEKFFIDSVKHYKDQITDPAQLEAVSVFIKQENWHRYVHQQYNRWLINQGFPAEYLEEISLKKLERTKEKIGRRGQLCVTASMEHVTSIFAEHMLTHHELLDSMHPHFRQVWIWHAIEELEHKSVAMDTLNAIGGGRRRQIMVLTTITFLGNIAKSTIILLKHDKQLYKWQTFKDACSLLFSPKNGLIIKLALPWFTFMKKNFHPTQQDTTILLSQFSKA